jgi:hypothetical protein
MGLSVKEAEKLLGDSELVPAIQAGIMEVKRMQTACLDAGIPALLGSDNHCKTGCAPKLMLLVREEDVPRLAQILRSEWVDQVKKGGTLEPRGAAGGEMDPEADPPCPACGAPGPLADDGTCNGCGLSLG